MCNCIQEEEEIEKGEEKILKKIMATDSPEFLKKYYLAHLLVLVHSGKNK